MKKNKRKDDYILIATAILLLILSGFLVFQFSPGQTLPSSQAPKIIGQAVLTIDFGNDKKRTFSGDIVANEDLIDVLYQASKAGNFSYKINENSEVILIEDISLGDKSSLKNNNKSWQWYLNNEKLVESPGKVNPRDGDIILIRYE